MVLNDEVAAFEDLHIQVRDRGLCITDTLELNIAESVNRMSVFLQEVDC